MGRVVCKSDVCVSLTTAASVVSLLEVTKPLIPTA